MNIQIHIPHSAFRIPNSELIINSALAIHELGKRANQEDCIYPEMYLSYSPRIKAI